MAALQAELAVGGLGMGSLKSTEPAHYWNACTRALQAGGRCGALVDVLRAAWQAQIQLPYSIYQLSPHYRRHMLLYYVLTQSKALHQMALDLLLPCNTSLPFQHYITHDHSSLS